MKQRQSLADVPEIIVRDRTNLDDYLYEPNSKYQKKEAEKMFDYLDFVFIDGEGNLLPWQRKCEKVNEFQQITFQLAMLFKMCKKTNKCMLAGGFGLQFLVYFCATNFTDIEVINGNEKGGHLTQIKEVNARMLPQLRKNQVFLDNLTGDYYVFEHERSEWKPYGNVGLHYSRAMASLGGKIGGDLIKKVTTYQQKHNDNKPVLFYSKLTDIKCNIKKQYISHWLIEGVPQEFIVENRNSWDPHPVNITNLNIVQQNYDALAESERGPQIATHLNSVVVQFHIDKKYKETVQILGNFIRYKMAQIQGKDKIDLTLDQAYLRLRQLNFTIGPSISQLSKRNSQEEDVSNSKIDSKNQSQTRNLSTTNRMRPATASQQLPVYTKEFLFSGLGYSKRRGAVVVDNNAVSSNPIPAATVKEQARLWSHRQISTLSNQNIKGTNTINSIRGGHQLIQNDDDIQKFQTEMTNYHDDGRNQQIFPYSNRETTATVNSRNQYMISSSSRIQSTGRNNQRQLSLGMVHKNSENKLSNRSLNKEDSQQHHKSSISDISSGQVLGDMQAVEKLTKKFTSLKHLRNYEIENQFKDQLKKDAEYLWKNQKELRQMLHPTLCSEFLPEDRDMTTKTGLLSASKSQNNLLSQTKKSQKNTINQTPSRSIYCRYNEFAKLPQASFDVPIIRNASPYVGCEEEQLRKREIDNKQSWIAHKDFKATFGKATTQNQNNYIKNYVSADPSQPPMLHKFREEQKGQWINGQFKF